MGEWSFSIVDTTLCSLDLEAFREPGFAKAVSKLAGSLHQVGVSAIDLGDLTDPLRFDLANQLAFSIPGLVLMAQCTMDRVKISHSHEALKASRTGRLGLKVPFSPEILHARPWQSYTALLDLVGDYVRFAKHLGLAVDLLVEDAAATDPVFVARVAQRAASAGAVGITLTDSGRFSTNSFGALVRRVVRSVPGVRVGVRCSNKSGQALGLVIAALDQGALEVGTVTVEWAPHLPCPGLDRLVSLGLLHLTPDQTDLLAVQTQYLLGPAGNTVQQAAIGTMET